jgi:hypothetical protein
MVRSVPISHHILFLTELNQQTAKLVTTITCSVNQAFGGGLIQPHVTVSFDLYVERHASTHSSLDSVVLGRLRHLGDPAGRGRFLFDLDQARHVSWTGANSAAGLFVPA